MDPTLISSVFGANGHLGNAEVTSCVLDEFETDGLGARFYRAVLSYSSGDHALPERMVVKRPVLTDRGEGEARVYEGLLMHEKGLPVMTCFGIVDEAPDAPLAMFFPDLSLSHTQTKWPVIPSLARCKQAVSALAAVHARWWGRTDAIALGEPPIARHQNPAHLATFFPAFVDLVGEYLSPPRRVIFENVLDRVGALVDQRLDEGHATFQHTDSHFWNFLYPHDAARHQCVMFDWPLWNTGLAGIDLAYMIGQHLYPEHRARFEPTLLEHYARSLEANGVVHGHAEVRLDYRLGLLVGFLMPLMEFSWQIAPSDWVPKMEKLFAAYDDNDCGELLGA